MNLPGYVASGNGWRIAKCIDVLQSEIAQRYPNATCLGTLGNIEHQKQGFWSDHNPYIKGPDGLGIVRAIDIGGPDDMLKELRGFLWGRYAIHDARVWRFGYMKGCSDNLINNWGDPFGTHEDDGDAGHLHISVTQKDGFNPSPQGYVAAIDSTSPWGLIRGVFMALSDAEQKELLDAVRLIRGQTVDGGGVAQKVWAHTTTSSAGQKDIGIADNALYDARQIARRAEKAVLDLKAEFDAYVASQTKGSA